jgi:Septum formation
MIAAFLVGGFIFRDRLTGGASDLKAGDCFDAKSGVEISKVQHHPCNETHTAEVVLVSDYPGAKGATYPTDAAFDVWGERTCAPAIVTYAGPSADWPHLGYGILVPNNKRWADGDRGMICYAVGDLPLTKSLRAAAS